jgi:hypothetical protein
VKLKLTVAAMLAALLIALPFEIAFTQWQYNPANFPKMVAWAGCTATVFTSDQHSPIESAYDSFNHRMYVGTHEDTDIPYYAGLMILMHETGHCLQDQEGLLSDYGDYINNPVKFELDADRRAADLMCGLGLDGRQLLRDTFQWAHDAFGYNGDDGHGTLSERMSQAGNAHACDKRVEQWARTSSF